MLLEVNLLTVCPCEPHVLPPHGKWVPAVQSDISIKHRSLSATYYGFRISERDGKSNCVCIKLEPQLINPEEVRRVVPWELYHRDGSDNEVGGLKMYKLYLMDNSHIKACLTPDVYAALMGC